MTATAARATYTVEAYNVSHASENKIHDDTVAKKLGFTGGLVPGVEVYAYATHLAVARWGRAFLERGTMDVRFQKPVYDGALATATAAETSAGIDLKVESNGDLCATGSASLPAAAPPLPSLAGFPAVVPPALEARPAATPAALPKAKQLGIRAFRLTPELHHQYLADVRETLPLYADAGLAHPGQLLRLANSALRENVMLPPWIHVGSRVQNFAAVTVGQMLDARAVVADNYERKGHRLVDLDVVILADGRPAARVLHTAIYNLRHLAAS